MCLHSYNLTPCMELDLMIEVLFFSVMYIECQTFPSPPAYKVKQVLKDRDASMFVLCGGVQVFRWQVCLE